MAEINRRYELKVKEGEVLADETRETFDSILLGSEIKPIKIKEKEKRDSEREILRFEEFFLIMQQGDYLIVRQLIEERDYCDSGCGDVRASFIARELSTVKAEKTEIDAKMNIILQNLEVLDVSL